MEVEVTSRYPGNKQHNREPWSNRTITLQRRMPGVRKCIPATCSLQKHANSLPYSHFSSYLSAYPTFYPVLLLLLSLIFLPHVTLLLLHLPLFLHNPSNVPYSFILLLRCLPYFFTVLLVPLLLLLFFFRSICNPADSLVLPSVRPSIPSSVRV